MPEMWQQPDGSWGELVLGPEAGEHQQLWPGAAPPGDDPDPPPVDGRL
jgi:hypothetical protein